MFLKEFFANKCLNGTKCSLINVPLQNIFFTSSFKLETFIYDSTMVINEINDHLKGLQPVGHSQANGSGPTGYN